MEKKEKSIPSSSATIDNDWNSRKKKNVTNKTKKSKIFILLTIIAICVIYSFSINMFIYDQQLDHDQDVYYTPDQVVTTNTTAKNDKYNGDGIIDTNDNTDDQVVTLDNTTHDNYYQGDDIINMNDFANSSSFHNVNDEYLLWYDSNYNISLSNWMVTYFNWHHQVRKTLNEQNWKNYNYLIMRCFHFEKCGGTTDRLRPLPLLLHTAYKTNRILLIYWTNPCPLQEFLTPPEGGINWIVPRYMLAEHQQHQNYTDNTNHKDLELYKDYNYLSSDQRPAVLYNSIKQISFNKNRRIVTVRFQSWHYGSQFYDKRIYNNHLDELPFIYVFRDVWNIFFIPSKPLLNELKYEMSKMNLHPGKYASVHVRALYSRKEETVSNQTIMGATKNAINCITEIIADTTTTTLNATSTSSTANDNNKKIQHQLFEPPKLQYYFASDSFISKTYAKEYCISNNISLQILNRTSMSKVNSSKSNSPIHLGFVNVNNTYGKAKKPWLVTESSFSNQTIDPKLLYDTFLDIYLIAYSRCVSYGHGGFGHWSYLIGPNSYFYYKGSSESRSIPLAPTCGIVHSSDQKRIRQSNCVLTSPNISQIAYISSSNYRENEYGANSTNASVTTTTTNNKNYHHNNDIILFKGNEKWSTREPPIPSFMYGGQHAIKGKLPNTVTIPKPPDKIIKMFFTSSSAEENNNNDNLINETLDELFPKHMDIE